MTRFKIDFFIFSKDPSIKFLHADTLTVIVKTIATFGYAPCAVPESFVRGGPTLTTLFFFFRFFLRGERNEVALKAGIHRPSSETPFKWRFAGIPMMAQL